MNNPFSKLGDMNKLRQQAMQMQKQLEEELITVENDGVKVVITGAQKIVEFSVQGVSSPAAIDVLNDAIKKSQKAASEKLSQMTGALGGMFGGGSQ